MKLSLNILILLLFSACVAKSEKIAVNKNTRENSIANTTLQSIDSTITHPDTVIINGLKYIQTLDDNNRFFCLLSINGDTIIKYEDYYFKSQFLDINEDGYEDIRIYIFSNTPNQCDNYLFDKNHNTFKKLENCDLDLVKISGTKFYYSYNRAGCADMNWQSYLCKIENYKLVDYGYIYGQGCDFEVKDHPQVIEIYKISHSNENEKKLLKTLPYLRHIPTFESKWEFIDTYWTQNCQKFN